MSRWIPILTSFALVSFNACTGELSVGDPEVEVTQLALGSDSLGALQAKPCVQLRGAQACPTYPNPLACEQLRVSVRGDGSTVGTCSIKGQAARTLRGVGDGIPLVCRMDYESGCIQCEDIYGGAVVDTCGEKQTQLFSGQGFLSEDSGSPVPPSGGEQSPPGPDGVPSGGGASSCDVQAQQSFVDKVNAILAAEGFKFSWSPDLANLPAGGGFFGSSFYFADKVCSGDAPGVQDITSCDWDAKAQGRCYCEEHDFMGVRCRCSRITAKVLGEACASIPAGCDAKPWGAAIWKVYGAASQWLIGGLFGGIPALGGAKTVGAASGPKDITCLGSPLVLDLEGDGVALGSADQGVRFDLLGSGPVRTAWVRGDDDALLALDRDGDGQISSGAELFGEGSTLGGRLAADGFQALAVLDRPDHGGNANGLLDPADLMYDQLVLWTDASHDGVSQPGELRPLADAGVAGIELSAARTERVVDASGNDLSLRARFLRQGGSSGLVVDALFTYR